LPFGVYFSPMMNYYIGQFGIKLSPKGWSSFSRSQILFDSSKQENKRSATTTTTTTTQVKRRNREIQETTMKRNLKDIHWTWILETHISMMMHL
jgi:hypothetical protein